MAEGQGRSSEQGVKLLYIRDYLHKYTNKEHPKSAKDIIEYLASKGIKAERKTIYNDIERLRTDFGVPVIYDAKKWGYYITEPEFEPHELRLMVDSIQASKFITQTEARNITQKIAKLADIYTKPGLTDRHTWVSDRVRSMNESVVREADRIAVLENGTITACAPHDVLMQTCAAYREIYASQTERGGAANE